MNSKLQQHSATARRAIESRDWRTVGACASEILRCDRNSAEGHFLAGLVEQARQRSRGAEAAFCRALELDSSRHDAAIELAGHYARSSRHAEAVELLQRYEPYLAGSPRYLNQAGQAYTIMGLHERAWPLYVKANELQPGVPALQANLAACDVYLGRIEEARVTYRALLERAPTHQRNHYELSQLQRASDATHVEQMQDVLEKTRLPPEKNIFLYYAIGKELEDLEQWDEAFRYYEMAGSAVTSVSPYDVAEDLAVIDKVIEVCNAEWLAAGAAAPQSASGGKAPIFVVGLPRTGSTLVDRILASHSQVESIGETFSLQAVLHRVSGVVTTDSMNAAIIEAASRQDSGRIASGYLERVAFRLGEKPMFIEKLPENVLYLGFIARAWPEARIVHVRRNPMDTCFALYKQSFFRYAYTLENLGRYYCAYDRLTRHWREVLGERVIEIEYESLVADQEGQTRRLLDLLGLPFESACLEFEKNESVVATASSVQVREKIHARSLGRWKHFEKHLRPLREMLDGAGIGIE